jgi:hypothetical protein
MKKWSPKVNLDLQKALAEYSRDEIKDYVEHPAHLLGVSVDLFSVGRLRSALR